MITRKGSLRGILLILAALVLALLLSSQAMQAQEEESSQGGQSPAPPTVSPARKMRYHRAPRNPMRSPAPMAAMPDVKGKFSSEAFTLLEHAGIKRWTIVEVQAKDNYDRIVDQRPPAGGMIGIGDDTQAVLYVARPIKTPEPLADRGGTRPSPHRKQAMGPAVIGAIIAAQLIVLLLIIHLLRNLKGEGPRSRITIFLHKESPPKPPADEKQRAGSSLSRK
jgi:hypothetical protein